MKVGCFCAEMKTNTVFEISREHLDFHFGLISEALGALLDPWAVIMALLEGVFFRVTFHPALERGGDPPGRLETSWLVPLGAVAPRRDLYLKPF